jgi:hypothetical protein
VFEDRNENLLGNILSLSPVPKNAIDDVEDLVLINPHELPKGVFFPSAQAAHEFSVTERHPIPNREAASFLLEFGAGK